MMDSKAIINGKEVILNKDEIDGAAEFHKSRVAFGVVNGRMMFNTNPADDRDHQHWICEDFGLSIEDFEKIVRGYMLQGGIYFYVGTDFKCVPVDRLTPWMIQCATGTYKQHFEPGDVNIYNGVEIGPVGTIWPGKTLLRTLSIK